MKKGINKLEMREGKEMMKVVKMLTILAIIFLAAYFLFSTISSYKERINYKGLTFVKDKFQGIPVFTCSYYIDYNSGTMLHNLYLRINPRENKIPVTGTGFDALVKSKNQSVFLSINSTGLSTCPDSQVSVAELVQFLVYNNFPVRIISGNANYEDSILRNQTYVTCDMYKNNSVILLQSGAESSVRKEGNCFILTAARCQLVQPVEKLIVSALVEGNISARQ